jgi:hypothetical protein
MAIIWLVQLYLVGRVIIAHVRYIEKCLHFQFNCLNYYLQKLEFACVD